MTTEETLRQIQAFNEARKREFGRAPTPEEPLPLPPTYIGGDVGDEPREDDE